MKYSQILVLSDIFFFNLQMTCIPFFIYIHCSPGILNSQPPFPKPNFTTTPQKWWHLFSYLWLTSPAASRLSAKDLSKSCLHPEALEPFDLFCVFPLEKYVGETNVKTGLEKTGIYSPELGEVFFLRCFC